MAIAELVTVSRLVINDNCTQQRGVENCVATLTQQALADQGLKGIGGGSRRSKLVAAVTASVLCGEAAGCPMPDTTRSAAAWRDCSPRGCVG